MASSFISKDNVYGFWVHDSIFQVVCRIIHDTIIEKYSIAANNDWVKRFLQVLDNNSKGYYHSYMHLDLDKLLTDKEQEKKLHEILELTKNRLDDKGEFISVSELKNWYQNGKIDYEWVSKVETSRLEKIIEYLELLVKDKITTKANDVGQGL